VCMCMCAYPHRVRRSSCLCALFGCPPQTVHNLAHPQLEFWVALSAVVSHPPKQLHKLTHPQLEVWIALSAVFSHPHPLLRTHIHRYSFTSIVTHPHPSLLIHIHYYAPASMTQPCASSSSSSTSSSSYPAVYFFAVCVSRKMLKALSVHIYELYRCRCTTIYNVSLPGQLWKWNQTMSQPAPRFLLPIHLLACEKNRKNYAGRHVHLVKLKFRGLLYSTKLLCGTNKCMKFAVWCNIKSSLAVS
jgi:hypothetical protein